jgi:hypothetical protein
MPVALLLLHCTLASVLIYTETWSALPWPAAGIIWSIKRIEVTDD